MGIGFIIKISNPIVMRVVQETAFQNGLFDTIPAQISVGCIEFTFDQLEEVFDKVRTNE